jgi:hypothetical protein
MKNNFYHGGGGGPPSNPKPDKDPKPKVPDAPPPSPREKGLTLFDLLTIILSAIFVLHLPFLVLRGKMPFIDWRPIRPAERIRVAEENFLDSTQETHVLKGCTSLDSDGDGRVSCDAKNTLDGGRIDTFECPYSTGFLADKGCSTRREFNTQTR